jgi:hypothetical protein
MATHALENGFENPQNDDGGMMIVCTSAVLRVHVLVAIAAIGEMMTINAKAFGAAVGN